MSLFNIQCEENLVQVANGSVFKDVANSLNDSKTIAFWSLDSHQVVYLQDKVTQSVSVTKIYHYNFVGNFLNVFALILESEIIEFSFKEEEDGFVRECLVKFKTDLTFSESNFNSYKEEIKKKASFINKSSGVLKDVVLCQNLQLLPFDFTFQKVAQEELNGYKVQKFTVIFYKNADDRLKFIADNELLKKIDHRYLGKHLEYFMMMPESPGCVFWLPKGWKLFKKLENFIRTHGYNEYDEVKTPFVMSNSFWQRSGHLASFKQNMMFVNMGGDINEDSALKPMSCPAHIEIFQHKNRSYKDLPFRIAEFGCCHRYEPSGSLHGLMRVRSLTQDDGHIFCLLEQIKSETSKFLKTCVAIYNKLGFKDVQVILATKPNNALGDSEEWSLAENLLKESLHDVDLKFSIAEGEGAFYGPKIEMHVKDSIGRSWQLGTIQLDFVLPERFGISVVDKNDEKSKVCMLHRAILGSMERFIGVLLEHCQGRLPIFLAPVQAVVCSVMKECNEYAAMVHNMLINNSVDAELDIRNETLSYKVREHKSAKIPALVIIGKSEINSKSVTLEYCNEKMIFKLDEVDKIMRLFNEN